MQGLQYYQLVCGIILLQHIITLPIMVEKYMIKNHLENNKFAAECF